MVGLELDGWGRVVMMMRKGWRKGRKEEGKKGKEGKEERKKKEGRKKGEGGKGEKCREGGGGFWRYGARTVFKFGEGREGGGKVQSIRLYGVTFMESFCVFIDCQGGSFFFGCPPGGKGGIDYYMSSPTSYR